MWVRRETFSLCKSQAGFRRISSQLKTPGIHSLGFFVACSLRHKECCLSYLPVKYAYSVSGKVSDSKRAVPPFRRRQATPTQIPKLRLVVRPGSLGIFFCLELPELLSLRHKGLRDYSVSVGEIMTNPRNTIPGFDLENEEEEKEETIESILEDYDLACEEPSDTRLYITTPDDGYDDFEEDERDLL